MVTKAQTTEDYEAMLTTYPDRRFELIHGEIVEKMPTQLHAAIVARLVGQLGRFLKDYPVGHILTKARYSLPDDDHNDRIPDLSFITHERGPLLAQGAAPYMPDLAVEVQSPGQSDRLMSDKAAYYLDNGSRMVWLIYPDRRLVEILTPTERQLLKDDGTLSGGDVLPDFSVPIAEIFPKSQA